MAGLFLLCWIRAEWRDRQRLRAFVDPEVMGIQASWPGRVAAILLLLSGVAAAAAVMALPMFRDSRSAPGIPMVQMVLDRASMEGGAERLWDGLDVAVQALSENAPGFRFSFALAGSPAETLVYPTADARGLQIMVSRLRFDVRPAAKWDGSQPLGAGQSAEPAVSLETRRVIATALPIDELERLSASAPGEIRDALWVHLPGDGRMPQYGRRNVTGQWTWTTDPAQIRPLWKAEPPGKTPAGRIGPTQWFALVALLLLCGEALCSQAARLRIRRSPFA